MAKPTPELIGAMRRTVQNLKAGSAYQWGHMGACNCGHLAQELTTYTKAEIHAYALQSRSGDWADQVSAFCPGSNLPLDLVISTMLDAGLSPDDLKHLERLSDQTILARLPFDERYLSHNKRDDVVKYLSTWADMLEERWLETTQAPSVQQLAPTLA